MKKKLISMLLAGTMILGMAGCGETVPVETSSAETVEISSETFAETDASSQTPENVDWMTPYEETVTISVAREAVTNEFPEGDDLTNNIWTRSYKDRFNVDVVTEWISDEYDTKLNLAIASGDLPDVFTVNNVQLKQLMEAGLLADLTDVYAAYASDTLKSIEESESDILETAQMEGRLYAIPSLYFGYQPNILWLRQDWLGEMGKEFPSTIEELKDILIEMKEKSGGYSLAVDQTLDGLYSLAIAWGAYPKLWVEGDDGQIIYGATAAEMKDALQEWADWYSQGILDPDFATMNSEALIEETVAGKNGAMLCGSWWGWNYGIDMIKNLGEEAYFMPCEIPTVSGEKAYYPMQFLNEDYIVVNKDCQNPEAAIKLINFYVYINNDAYPSGDMTQEEVSEYTANNMQHNTKVFTVNNPADDYNRYKMITEARETGDESVMTTAVAIECYNGAKLWTEEKNPDGFGYAAQFGMDGCGMEVCNGIVEDDRIMRTRMWGGSPQVLLDYGSTLDDILLEGFTKIIMGTENVDYFDTLIDQWYAAGGQEVTDAVNEMYQ